MAPGMKSWLAIAVGSVAVVSALLIPVREPEQFRFGLYEDALPEEVRLHALKQRLLYEQEKLLRMDLRDSLTAMLSAKASNPQPVVVVGTTRPSPSAERFEQQIVGRAAELGSYRDVDLGVFELGSVQRRPPELSWNLRHDEYLIGEAHGRPYCIIQHFRSASATMNSELGACAFVLRHGLPGEGVNAWLAQGNFHRATWKGRSPVDALISREKAGSPYEMEHSRWYFSLELNRCLVGEIAACEQAFLEWDGARGEGMDPVAQELSEAIPGLWVSGRSDQGQDYRQRRMLADLETQFGTERFARFWTSEMEVRSAFQDAFGASAAEWMHEWALANYPGIRGGFRAELGNGLHMIVVIIVALAVGVARERRRRVAA